MGLELTPDWSRTTGPPPPDVHGVVVTYQQVAADPTGVAALSRNAVVVLDEVHHAGDEMAWGDALRVAFAPAKWRLSLSGTPFRSDTAAIPFVRYDGDRAVPDVEYGYADALGDGGVVRPVYFPRQNGRMEWTAPDGTHRTHTFDDRLDRTAASQRLRTALSVDGQWLPSVLAQADDRLQALRRDHRAAAGLVLATDVDHARGIASLLRTRLGRRAVVVTNDDHRASERIAAFAGSLEPWIVAVRMVSEGVDIPRLRVGVYATTTTTELFFRQAVGRLVRWTSGMDDQPAYLFIPDDHRLRTHAATIAEHRRHTLRRPEGDEEAEPPPERAERTDADDEQLSLFAAISATPMGGPSADAPRLPGFATDPARPEPAGQPVELAPPPPLPGRSAGPPGAPVNGRAEREHLRAGNRERARAIAAASGMPHARVNAELNRLAGVRSVNGATIVALRRRLDQADRWLARL
jgi:superfamily II DNA or RNA helicase